MAKDRFDVVRASKGGGFLVWDNDNFDFVRNANGSLVTFEDETAAYIYIDKRVKG